MLAVKARIVVEEDGKATIDLPPEVPAGEHQVIVVLEEGQAPASPRRHRDQMRDFPIHDLGPWPEGLSLRREDMYGDDGR